MEPALSFDSKCSSPIHSLDRIHLLSSTPLKEIWTHLVPLLRPHVSFITIKSPSLATIWRGYRTSLQITVPSQAALDILCEHECLLGKVIITRMEIARDTLNLALDYNDTILSYETAYIVKWSTRHNPVKTSLFNNPPPKPEGVLSTETLYAGSKKVWHTVYCRNSKITGTPCLHCEWTIVGSAKIQHVMELVLGFTPFTLRDLALIPAKDIYQAIERHRLKPGLFDFKKVDRAISKETGRRPGSNKVKSLIEKIQEFEIRPGIPIGNYGGRLYRWAESHCVSRIGQHGPKSDVDRAAKAIMRHRHGIFGNAPYNNPFTPSHPPFDSSRKI